jgi:hypothetical protein
MRPLAFLALLAGCRYSGYAGHEDFDLALRIQSRDPAEAQALFRRAWNRLMDRAETPQPPGEELHARSLAVRCSIELGLARAADDQIRRAAGRLRAIPIRGAPGDPVGLHLIRAERARIEGDLELALTELQLAGHQVAPGAPKRFIALREVRILREVGTPWAIRRALEICERHGGDEFALERIRIQKGR